MAQFTRVTDVELAEFDARQRAALERIPPELRPSMGPWHTIVAGTGAKPDENEKYRREFRAEPEYAKSMSEAEYIAMRRIDDGLAWCEPRQAGDTPAPAAAVAHELVPAGKSYECGSEHFLA